MNKHDPLCGWGSDTHPECFPAEDCGNCEMIQRIRLSILNDKYHEDIIEIENAYDEGYKDALRDCNTTFEEYMAQRKEWDDLIDTINKISKESNRRRVVRPTVPKEKRAEVLQEAVDRMMEVFNDVWTDIDEE